MLEIIDTLSEEYTVIITTDHGGHNYTHGTELPEDMTIPIFIIGEYFEDRCAKNGGSILDIAPTVAELLGISPVTAWEGGSLVKKP